MSELPTIAERLASLETKVHLKFDELDKALVLAAMLAKDDRVNAAKQVHDHFEVINQFQKRMDKMADTFATREWVIERLDPIRKLIYLGTALAVAVGFVLRFVFCTG